MTLKRAPVTNILVVKDVNCGLVTYSDSNLVRWRKYFSQLFNVHGVMLFGRLKYTQQDQYCLSRVILICRRLFKSSEDTNHQVMIKSQQNCLKREIRYFALISINLLLLFGIRRNCLRI